MFMKKGLEMNRFQEVTVKYINKSTLLLMHQLPKTEKIYNLTTAFVVPNAKICLDLFHWLVRWDEIFNDKTCSDYFKFRAFMSRAILLVSDEQYKEQKELLVQKLQQQPTVKEILHNCNTKEKIAHCRFPILEKKKNRNDSKGMGAPLLTL